VHRTAACTAALGTAAIFAMLAVAVELALRR
jgi:hypothetical protein